MGIPRRFCSCVKSGSYCTMFNNSVSTFFSLYNVYSCSGNNSRQIIKLSLNAFKTLCAVRLFKIELFTTVIIINTGLCVGYIALSCKISVGCFFIILLPFFASYKSFNCNPTLCKTSSVLQPAWQ